MSIEKMKHALIQKEQQLFTQFGLIHYPEVVVKCFDPYSLAPERDKIFLLLKEATLKLHPNGLVTIQKLKRKVFISEMKAKILINGSAGIKLPYHALEFTNIYESKLEADLMHKPLITIPEKIDAEGGIIPYNTNILESLICDALTKFAQNSQADSNEIIDLLTTPYPYGGGWYTRNTSLIQDVNRTLQQMFNRGLLDYDENTQIYTFVSKSSSTKLR